MGSNYLYSVGDDINSGKILYELTKRFIWEYI